MTGPIPLGAVELALGASLLLVNGLLSLWLGLGLERKLLVAAVRATVQLLVLGWVLVPVFALASPWLVGAVCLAMTGLAGWEASRRPDRSYRGVLGSSVLAMAIGGGATALVATGLVIGVEPWWSPRYLIPLVGMILGNALTGVSLGLDRCLSILDERRGEVEALLAMGATRWEAARPVVAESLRTGMIPILNTMSAVGLVTIPGMMTGQILGGTDPQQAARYQILILFLIASAVALGTSVAVFGCVAALFDEQHRLRAERIER